VVIGNYYANPVPCGKRRVRLNANPGFHTAYDEIIGTMKLVWACYENDVIIRIKAEWFRTTTDFDDPDPIIPCAPTRSLPGSPGIP